MLLKPLRLLWGDLTSDEIKKFSILSVTLLFIIGAYWILRSMKDPIFESLVGFEWQPRAKMISLGIMILMVLIYSKLVDLCEKQTLFFIFCTFFGLAFIGLSYGIAHPHFVSLAPTSPLFPVVSWIPGKLIGWVNYILSESLGSLLVTLFWALVASTTNTESAKKGYAMIVFFTQIGSISGAFIVTSYAKTLGLPSLTFLGGLLILLVPLLIKIYLSTTPSTNEPVATTRPTTQTGFFEGAKILFTRPYVMGIFAIATLYEIIGVILEYQMKTIAKNVYPTALDGGTAFAEFSGFYGISLNVLALLFALLGTSFLMRRFGLLFCLIAYPVTIGVVISALFSFNFFSTTSPHQVMWSIFLSMVAIKGLNYSLNNPTKEVLYIPTSRDIKFKAKGWIDTFGNRSTKGAGAVVTNAFRHSLDQLLIYGTAISLGVVIGWIFVAVFVGNTFKKLQDEEKIVT